MSRLTDGAKKLKIDIPAVFLWIAEAVLYAKKYADEHTIHYDLQDRLE